MHALKYAHHDRCLRRHRGCATDLASNMQAFQDWCSLKRNIQGLFISEAGKMPFSTAKKSPHEPSQFRGQASVCGGLFFGRHLATLRYMMRATLALSLLFPYGRSC